MQSAAEIDPKYRRNIDALMAVQPRPLGPTDITVRLGANWVPASDISSFAIEVIGGRIDVAYNPILGSWSVESRLRDISEFGFDKMSADKILDSVLNSRQIKVTWRDSEGRTHVDLEATEKANDIAKKLRERFRTWIWSDAGRADRLVKYYNENFNNIAPRKFDGSHLTLPGVSSRISLYPHQKRAVWRIIQQGNAYLAHSVGAGKTMEMIAAGMEERRLGIVKKADVCCAESHAGTICARSSLNCTRPPISWWPMNITSTHQIVAGSWRRRRSTIRMLSSSRTRHLVA